MPSECSLQSVESQAPMGGGGVAEPADGPGQARPNHAAIIPMLPGTDTELQKQPAAEAIEHLSLGRPPIHLPAPTTSQVTREWPSRMPGRRPVKVKAGEGEGRRGGQNDWGGIMMILTLLLHPLLFMMNYPLIVITDDIC